eukprot:3460245-Amphidinium_carterae.1
MFRVTLPPSHGHTSFCKDGGIQRQGLCSTTPAHLGKRNCAAQNCDLSPTATGSGGWGKMAQGTKQLSSSPNPSHGAALCRVCVQNGHECSN